MSKQPIPNNEKITWEMLTTSYNLNNDLLMSSVETYLSMLKIFGNIIEKDQDLVKELNGANVQLESLQHELTSILVKHAKVTVKQENGNDVYDVRPYIGVVSSTNDKHMALYTACIVAYDGINEKITNISGILNTHILGSIYALADKLGIDITDKKDEVSK